MDEAELLAKHPALHAAMLAQGHKAGATAERKRVSAHLILAEGSGDNVSALKAIKDGDECDAVAQATHQAASMKKAQIAAREGDNTDGADGADGGTSAEGGEGELDADGNPVAKPGVKSKKSKDDIAAEAVADQVEAALGIEVEAK